MDSICRPSLLLPLFSFDLDHLLLLLGPDTHHLFLRVRSCIHGRHIAGYVLGACTIVSYTCCSYKRLPMQQINVIG